MNKIIKLLLIFIISIPLLSCGGFKKVDQRSRPTDPEERRRQAVAEGRGTGINDLFKKRGGTNFEFSSSNPMWRASLETLDFLPLTTVDYSGGIIISDWYYDSTNNSNESIKIAIRFLSNEIRSESLKVTVHQRTCEVSNNCKIIILDNSNIQEELYKTILKKASLIEKDQKNKKK